MMAMEVWYRRFPRSCILGVEYVTHRRLGRTVRGPKCAQTASKGGLISTTGLRRSYEALLFRYR